MSQEPIKKTLLREICGEENPVEEVTLLNEDIKKKWQPHIDGTYEPLTEAQKRKTTTVIL